MQSWKLLTIAIALLPCATSAADEITYSTLSIDSDIALASFDAPPVPATPVELVDPSYYATPSDTLVTPEVLTCPPQVTCSSTGGKHWFGGIDLGSTTVNHSNGSFALDKHRTGLSLRPYFGCEDVRGVGFRAQVWLFRVETETFTAGTGEAFDLETGAVAIDLDIYKRLQLNATSLVMGVGSRIASIDWTFPNGSEDSVTAGGMSAFAEGYQPYKTTPKSEWGCIGGARMSVVSGRAKLDNSSAYSSTDGMIQIADVNMGLQYRRYFEFCDFLMQVRLEKQFWDTNVFGDLAYTTTGLRLGWEW